MKNHPEKQRKLSLVRETLVPLQNDEIGAVYGGATPASFASAAASFAVRSSQPCIRSSAKCVGAVAASVSGAVKSVADNVSRAVEAWTSRPRQ